MLKCATFLTIGCIALTITSELNTALSLYITFNIILATRSLVCDDLLPWAAENLNITQHKITIQIISMYLITCFKIFLFIDSPLFSLIELHFFWYFYSQ